MVHASSCVVLSVKLDNEGMWFVVCRTNGSAVVWLWEFSLLLNCAVADLPYMHTSTVSYMLIFVYGLCGIHGYSQQ